MMLSFDEITAIVSDVAWGLHLQTDLVATTPAGHDSSYVEVVVSITDPENSRRLMFRLNRTRPLGEVYSEVETIPRDRQTLARSHR
jgi:hypothetical protein